MHFTFHQLQDLVWIILLQIWIYELSGNLKYLLFRILEYDSFPIKTNIPAFTWIVIATLHGYLKSFMIGHITNSLADALLFFGILVFTF